MYASPVAPHKLYSMAALATPTIQTVASQFTPMLAAQSTDGFPSHPILAKGLLFTN